MNLQNNRNEIKLDWIKILYYGNKLVYILKSPLDEGDNTTESMEAD